MYGSVREGATPVILSGFCSSKLYKKFKLIQELLQEERRTQINRKASKWQ